MEDRYLFRCHKCQKAIALQKPKDSERARFTCEHCQAVNDHAYTPERTAYTLKELLIGI